MSTTQAPPSHDDVVTIRLSRDKLREWGSRGGSATAKRPDTAERMARARESWLDQLAARIAPTRPLPPESRRAVAIAARNEYLARARQDRARRHSVATEATR